ncbi:MAG: hypothetical protein KIT72_16815 [Polyangiaceae bacterium]|nr:hypothetical protein [Polyangiaceae bacterium]MCW5792081.1 hypothetical protein [Polyangiaceae bacterium]
MSRRVGPQALGAGLGLASLMLSAAASATPNPPPSPPKCEPTRAKTSGPPTAHVLAGDQEHYSPLLRLDMDECAKLEVPIYGSFATELSPSVAVDRELNEYQPGVTHRPRFRIGARYNSGLSLAPVQLHAEYEHDLYTGILGDETSLDAGAAFPIDRAGYPSPVPGDHELRKAYLRFSLAQYAHLTAGWQTSHWGLGLLANDGAHGWTPGSASFSNPISGDRVLRGQLATGPLTDLGLMVAVGMDWLDQDLLADDDVLLEGDTARQFVGAIMLGEGHAHGGGAYAAKRRQESPDGRVTDVLAMDLYLRSRVRLGPAWLHLQTEAAYITGTTDLAPTSDFEEHDVRQFGLAARADLDAGLFGSVVDVLYASGDSNFDDEKQTAFKADPNYEMGLLLYRQVIAAQTARTVATAADPNLVGVPADDLDRLPTRGSVTNTLAVFPRLRVRPTAGLELYGGALFAFAAQDPADAFNTRVIGGGSPRNAFGSVSSRMLGTEYDIGIRYRLNVSGAEATLGGEAGVFTPGPAFTQGDGQQLAAMGGARLMLDVRM